MGQSERGALPRLVLPNLLWSMSEPIPQSISDLIDATSDYALALGEKADLKQLEVEFPGRSLDVHFSTWDRPSDTYGWIETKKVIAIRFDHNPSYAAILLELHKATHACLSRSDKHFFEGLELLSEGEAGAAPAPAYCLCLGS